ncbi:MAG: hypothetical protein ABI703_08890 [Gemmatimonadales bacterium]
MRNLFPFILLSISSCSPRTSAAHGPGGATPLPDPRTKPGAVADRGGLPARRPSDPAEERRVPVRAEQAPLVHVREVLTTEGLLGRRVRVAGRCAARGESSRAGSWTLEQGGATIEVRGLVPTSCAPDREQPLTIFAQVEPKAAGSPDRILLRLPD